MGPKLKNHLSGLRPVQLDVLVQGFKDIDGDGGEAPMSAPSEKKTTVETNINAGGLKKKKKEPTKSAAVTKASE
jgi:hypothetical protein